MLHPLAGAAYANLTIGLLGGSFNPAHDGHRTISLHALKRLGLDQVWWLVSPQNPLKPTEGMAALEKRMEEARLVANNPRIIVTDIEGQMRTRYTIDTLRTLKKRFPRTNFVWLMGADNFSQLPRWREWSEIFQIVPVAVFRRPAYAAGRGRGKVSQRFGKHLKPGAHGKKFMRLKPPVWFIMDNRLNNLSATAIRKERPSWQS